eukprot:UN12200
MFDKYLEQNNIYTEVNMNNKQYNIAYNPPQIDEEVADQKIEYIPINDVTFTRKIHYPESLTPFSGATRTPFTYSESNGKPYYYSKSASKPFNKSKSKSPFTYTSSKTSKSKMEIKKPIKSSVTNYVNSYDSQIFESQVEMQSTM